MVMIRGFFQRLLCVLSVFFLMTAGWGGVASTPAEAQIRVAKVEIPDTFPSMIQGVVWDQSGNEVTSALVEAFWPGGIEAVLSTQTNDRGFYALQPLEAGRYVVQVSIEGYHPMTLETSVLPGRFKDLYFEGLEPAIPGNEGSKALLKSLVDVGRLAEEVAGVDGQLKAWSHSPPRTPVGRMFPRPSPAPNRELPALADFREIPPDVGGLHRIEFFPVPPPREVPAGLEAIDRSPSAFAIMELGDPFDPPFPDYAAEVAGEMQPEGGHGRDGMAAASELQQPTVMDILGGGVATPTPKPSRPNMRFQEPTTTQYQADEDRFWRLIRASRARRVRRNHEVVMAIRFPPPPRIVLAQRGSER